MVDLPAPDRPVSQIDGAAMSVLSGAFLAVIFPSFQKMFLLFTAIRSV